MINSRLSIYNPTLFEWIDVSLTKEIIVSTSYSIADVRNISKKNASATKTVEIFGSKQVNELFELIFEINSELTAFNPNLRRQVKYFLGYEESFSGNLQLLDITKKYNGMNLEVIYSCSLVGYGGDLFSAIGDNYLNAISFADLNHTMLNSVLTTYPTVLGEGICYPFIDYGILGNNGTTWRIKHLKPAIFAREYLRRIFLAAGKTWTSVHLDSPYFRRLIIPCVNEGNLKRSQTLIDNSQFNAGKNVNSPYNIAGTTLGLNWRYNTNPIFDFANPAPFNLDSPLPFFDIGNVYNNGTFVFTPNYSGLYSLNIRVDLDIVINPPAGTATYQIINAAYGFQTIVTSAGTPIASTFNSVIPNITSPTTFSINIIISSIFLTAGNATIVKIAKSDSFNFLTNFKTIGGANITSGNSSLDIRMLSTSTFSALLATGDIEYGDLVEMNQTIPPLVKQRDFLSAIMQMENLYMEPDKNNPNNFIIEPRETFIDYTNALDWTDKLDISKSIKIRPMGDLDFKNLIFDHTSDKDEYNVAYEDTYKETYSTKRVIVDNDFTKNDKNTKLLFAATPMVGNNFNDIIASKMYKNDNGIIKPMACKIRILYWGGQTTCNPYTLSGSGFPVTNQTTYNYAGMCDNPYNPTISIDWTVPRKLYYLFPNQSYTTNNLYNRGYSKLIQELIDPNSKIVRAFFNLSAYDIATFSFRKLVFVDGTYYFINNIISYDPNSYATTEVEMLKLKRGITFVPQAIPFIGDPVLVNMMGNGNPNPNVGIVYGENNINFGENILIVGNNNFVG